MSSMFVRPYPGFVRLLDARVNFSLMFNHLCTSNRVYNVKNIFQLFYNVWHVLINFFRPSLSLVLVQNIYKFRCYKEEYVGI